MSSNGFKDSDRGEDSRGGRLSTVRNPGTVAKVRELVARHRRMTLQFTETQLHINRDTIRLQIPHEDLGKQAELREPFHTVLRSSERSSGSHLMKTSPSRVRPQSALSQLRRY
jgi:hypothetical protein